MKMMSAFGFHGHWRRKDYFQGWAIYQPRKHAKKISTKNLAQVTNLKIQKRSSGTHVNDYFMLVDVLEDFQTASVCYRIKIDTCFL